MNERRPESPQAASLRERAENTFREMLDSSLENLDALSPETLRASLYELRVHQIELEMQNEDLRRAQTDLDASRARYFDLYDMAPVGYCTVSEKGLILEANLAAANLLGLNREEMVKKPFSRWILKEDSDHFFLLHKELISSSEPQKCELRMVKAGGGAFWAHLEATAATAPDGAPACRVALIDITARKRISAVLQARVRISEYALTHSLGELLTLTLDEAELLTGSTIGFFHFVEADQLTLSLQEWSTNTHLRMCTAEGGGRHYPVDEAGVWADALRERRPVIYNDYASLPHRKGLPPGHSQVVRMLVVPILRNGKVVALLGIGNKPGDYDSEDIEITSQLASLSWDIAERKRAEKELRVSEEKYRGLFESMMDGFVSVAMDGKFLECNEVYQDMLGYSETELAHLTYTDITPEKWRAVEAGIVDDQILKRGYSDVYEKEYRHKDGSIFSVELHAVLTRDEQGNPASIWAIVRDISARKRAEEELLKKSAEIESFTYAVSHDLKSPLVTIKAFLGYLEEDLKTHRAERVAKDLGYLHGAAGKMELTLNELLKLVRIGHLQNPPIAVPLQEIVSEVLELVAGQIAELGVQVETTKEPVWLYGDRQRLVQLFQNLVDNAVKFMGDQPAPRIEIGAEPEGEEIVLFVRDNGKGIDPRHRSKLFGLFEKLDPNMPGSGMGLATVRSIVKMHGGKIHAQSEGLGKGTTFRFTLAKTERNPTST